MQPASAKKQEILSRARALAPRFTERAMAAEEARRISPQSAQDMLDAGFARILLHGSPELTRGMTRALLTQVFTFHSPDDTRIAVAQRKCGGGIGGHVARLGHHVAAARRGTRSA